MYSIKLWNISHSKKNWARYDKKCTLVLCNCHLFLSDFNEPWVFFDKFSKNPQISNFIKIRPVGAELFHADEQTDERTDMTELTVAFRNSANAPKNSVAVKELWLHLFCLDYLESHDNYTELRA